MSDRSLALASARVLVVQEWLLEMAGGERAIEGVMSVVPHADLIAGAVSDEMRAQSPVMQRARSTWLGQLPVERGKHRRLIPLQYPTFAAIDTRGYDLVVSNSSAFGKAVRPQPGVPHVCYCQSPPRWLWDMAGVYQRHEQAGTSAILRFAKKPLQWLDRRSAAGVTHFVANSHFTAQRIRLAYDRESVVVYPPVSPKPVPPRAAPREDFLLVFGRLVAYKRVDLAIDAAERLGIRLIIAGDGPDRARLEGHAGKHTQFLGAVSEVEAGELLEKCRAFVFCATEDYGIAPIEANAHGAPVVGFARGGLTETMSPESAVFFEEEDPAAVAAAITTALERSWDEAAIRANAERFALPVFRQRFAEVLEGALSGA